MTGKAVSRGANNVASVNARILAISEALRNLNLLRLDADQSRLAERFAEIRAALPAIDQNPQLEASAAE